MYRQVLIPDKKNHSFEMPEQFFGKKVEVTVVELNRSTTKMPPAPPNGKIVSADELLEHFGEAPDFPTATEIRSKTWPSKW